MSFSNIKVNNSLIWRKKKWQKIYSASSTASNFPNNQYLGEEMKLYNTFILIKNRQGTHIDPWFFTKISTPYNRYSAPLQYHEYKFYDGPDIIEVYNFQFGVTCQKNTEDLPDITIDKNSTFVGLGINHSSEEPLEVSVMTFDEYKDMVYRYYSFSPVYDRWSDILVNSSNNSILFPISGFAAGFDLKYRLDYRWCYDHSYVSETDDNFFLQNAIPSKYQVYWSSVKTKNYKGHWIKLPSGSSLVLNQISTLYQIYDNYDDIDLEQNIVIIANYLSSQNHSSNSIIKHYKFTNIYEIEKEIDVNNTVTGKYLSNVMNNTLGDQYIFFTDCHCMGNNGTFDKNNVLQNLKVVKEYQDALPVNFVLNGGDWLNAGDTQTQAYEKLNYLTTTCKSLFNKFYRVVGNHDTNYRGKLDSESQADTGSFTPSQIANIYCSDFGHAYYSFVSGVTRYFVFDTEKDSDVSGWEMSADYINEQLSWFKNELSNAKEQHFVITLHISYVPVAQYVFEIADMYNKRLNGTVNNINFDFRQTSAIFHYAIYGHYHSDSYETIKNIPCIVTLNAFRSEMSFDIVCADYNAKKIKLTRVGSGSDRIYDIL